MKKRYFIMLLIALLLIGCANTDREWQEQYDLGVRYLDEGNYEEAILAFSAAIEIDPNNADAYALRGDAYVLAAKLDPEKAEDYLRLARKDYKRARSLDPDLEQEMEEKLDQVEELEDALADPAAGMIIPSDAYVWEGHSYYLFDRSGDWEDAVSYCESLGGHLAIIESQAENDALYAYMLEQGYESAYIGLTDREEEGTWVWLDGKTALYLNWHSGEPNGENSNEDYAMFYYKYDDGTWNDGDFGGSTVNGGCTFLCEWDATGASNTELPSEPDGGDWMQNPRYSFDTFLAEKTYLGYWVDTYGPPEAYTLLDINGDNVEELILLSGTTNGFYGYQIYFFDLETGEIRLAELESGNPGTLYGTMNYCPEHTALVFNCVRNMASDGFREYHAFDGTGFTCIGSIGWTNFDEYLIDLYGVTTNISYEEWVSITGSYQTPEFTELP